MPNLSELQADMKSQDQAKVLTAARVLTDYFLSYNEEYNALLDTSARADAELFRITHDPAGVNTADMLRIQGLLLYTQSRMKTQDERLMAFHASAFAISPPTPAMVADVTRAAREKLGG